MWYQDSLQVNTSGRGTYDVTSQINLVISNRNVDVGLCHLFLQHTSASLILCENADPSVRRDLEYFMAKTVVDGDPGFHHTSEGKDDMSAHIRSVLTHNSLSIPIADNRMMLGIWQGVYLWEHRSSAHLRRLIVTVHR